MISLIVAMSRNRVIGVQNRLPWRIPEDLKNFRRLTTGHPVVMGRKTFESIGKPLPDRTNFVVSRDPGFAAAGCRAAGSLDEALSSASASEVPGHEEVFVIGGGEIYRQALGRADRIYMTYVDRDVDGDAFFPEFDWKDYRVLSREARTEPFPFEFLTLEKNPRP